MDNVVRMAMQPVTDKIDIIREAAEQSGNTTRAEAFRESINMIRDGIVTYEEKYVENLQDSIREAYQDSFSLWLVIDEIKSYIAEKMDEAKSDAIDSVMYDLECKGDWTEEMFDNYRHIIEDTIDELLRDETLGEGFDY